MQSEQLEHCEISTVPFNQITKGKYHVLPLRGAQTFKSRREKPHQISFWALQQEALLVCSCSVSLFMG